MKMLLFLAALIFIGVTTYSQTYQKSFASLGGVISIPVGDISVAWGVGFNVHGNAGYVFHKNVAARVDLQYNTFPYKESGDYSGYSLKSTSIMGDVMVGMFDKDADIKPYGLVGMGLYLNSVSDMKYQGVTYYRGSSETNFGMKIGGGAAFKVSPRLSLFGETSFNIIFGEGTANYLPIKAGATINF
ncbi:MAG: outer membrane beta-barrel protein [Ignavibacteria bacterium]|nr:outer membrane beta-barrel protein [Ignavibacteria bacterium]